MLLKFVVKCMNMNILIYCKILIIQDCYVVVIYYIKNIHSLIHKSLRLLLKFVSVVQELCSALFLLLMLLSESENISNCEYLMNKKVACISGYNCLTCNCSYKFASFSVEMRLIFTSQ